MSVRHLAYNDCAHCHRQTLFNGLTCLECKTARALPQAQVTLQGVSAGQHAKALKNAGAASHLRGSRTPLRFGQPVANAERRVRLAAERLARRRGAGGRIEEGP
jgi:hypothetical protein